jgi:hypothetical protein
MDSYRFVENMPDDYDSHTFSARFTFRRNASFGFIRVNLSFLNFEADFESDFYANISATHRFISASASDSRLHSIAQYFAEFHVSNALHLTDSHSILNLSGLEDHNSVELAFEVVTDHLNCHHYCIDLETNSPVFHRIKFIFRLFLFILVLPVLIWSFRRSFTPCFILFISFIPLTQTFSQIEFFQRFLLAVGFRISALIDVHAFTGQSFSCLTIFVYSILISVFEAASLGPILLVAMGPLTGILYFIDFVFHIFVLHDLSHRVTEKIWNRFFPQVSFIFIPLFVTMITQGLSDFRRAYVGSMLPDLLFYGVHCFSLVFLTVLNFNGLSSAILSGTWSELPSDFPETESWH